MPGVASIHRTDTGHWEEEVQENIPSGSDRGVGRPAKKLPKVES